MSRDTQTTDREFVASLRAAVNAYLGAVDRWEEAFQKHYRMPDCVQRISTDMEAEQRDYDERRRDLEALMPRARRLCLKLDVRDPFRGLLRVSLGRFAPQQRMDSAIGRGERSSVSACLIELQEACTEWPAESSEAEKPRSLWDRMIDYFY